MDEFAVNVEDGNLGFKHGLVGFLAVADLFAQLSKQILVFENKLVPLGLLRELRTDAQLLLRLQVFANVK